MFVFYRAKYVTYIGFLRFSSFFFSACAATNRATSVEDTHLTLAVIPFKVGAKTIYVFAFTNI